MATFKVGQRVKAVRAGHAGWDMVNVGDEGVIDHPLTTDERYGVRWDKGHHSYSLPEALTPLTDPGADAFLESIRKLKPYEEPKVERELVRIPSGENS